jgi:hypothetical protein
MHQEHADLSLAVARIARPNNKRLVPPAGTWPTTTRSFNTNAHAAKCTRKVLRTASRRHGTSSIERANNKNHRRDRAGIGSDRDDKTASSANRTQGLHVALRGLAVAMDVERNGKACAPSWHLQQRDGVGSNGAHHDMLSEGGIKGMQAEGASGTTLHPRARGQGRCLVLRTVEAAAWC